MWSDLGQLIEAYYRRRGLAWPDVWEALGFAVTELGEVYEVLLARRGGWVRNNQERHGAADDAALAEELGDVLMMVMVAGMAAGVDPLDALLLKIALKWNHGCEEVCHADG